MRFFVLEQSQQNAKRWNITGMKADELCNLILCSRAPLVIANYSIIFSDFCRAECEFAARWSILWEEHYNEYLIGQIASGFSGDSVWFRAMQATLQACFVLVQANKRSEPWDQGCRILSSAWSERPPGSWWTPPAWSGSASRCRPPRPAEHFPVETPGSDWYGSWSRRDEGQKG